MISNHHQTVSRVQTGEKRPPERGASFQYQGLGRSTEAGDINLASSKVETFTQLLSISASGSLVIIARKPCLKRGSVNDARRIFNASPTTKG